MATSIHGQWRRAPHAQSRLAHSLLSAPLPSESRSGGAMEVWWHGGSSAGIAAGFSGDLQRQQRALHIHFITFRALGWVSSCSRGIASDDFPWALGRKRRQTAARRAAVSKWLRRGSGIVAAAAPFDPSSRASVLNKRPAANLECTNGAPAAATRVVPRLKKPFDSSPWVVPSL